MTDDTTPISNPRSSYRHESGNHGERIARLESDVFNITNLLSGDIHDKLQTLQAGVDTIKAVLGDGHVLFQKLEDAHVANGKDIEIIKEERKQEKEEKKGRKLYLLYPIVVGVVLIVLDVIFLKRP